MKIVAVLLMIGSALGVAAHGMSRRWVLREKVLTVTGVLVFPQAITVIFWLGYIFFLASLNIPTQKSRQLFWMGIIVTVVVNIWIQYAGAKSSELGEASLTAPVAALTPGLVTIPALAFGEWPSRQGWTGIGCIVVGNFIHAREGAPLKEWWKVFALLRAPSGRKGSFRDKLSVLSFPADFHSLPLYQQEAWRKCLTLRWAYGQALGGVIGLVFDSVVGRNGEAAVGIAWKWLLLASIFSALHMRTNRREANSLPKPSKPMTSQSVVMVALCGIGLALGDGLSVIAFRLAPVAYVGALKRLSVVFTVLLSLFFLGEKKATIRLFPAVIVTAGAMLLASDGMIASVIGHVERRLGQ